MEQGDEDNLESFLKWAAHLGISDSSQPQNHCLGHCLSVSYFPHSGRRGLAAVRDIKKGELVLKVPECAMITSGTLLKDQKLSLLVLGHPSLSSTQVLSVCLLYEMGKGKSSQWYTYLLQLPRSYDTLETFGDFEMQALQVDEAIWASEKARVKSESEWKEAQALMEELKIKPKLRTCKAWLWASATISSRTMHVPWDEAGCLCPVGDFFNYSPPGEELLYLDDFKSSKNASSGKIGYLHDGKFSEESSSEQFDGQFQRLIDGGYEEDVGAYCLYANKNYKKGDQVLLSYGTYTNLELLEHYGFLLDQNPNDKVFISLEPDMYSCSSWPNDSIYIHQNGKPSFALLCSLRIWATPINQRRSLGHVAYSGSQLSSKNEVVIMKWISRKCQTILESLPTSIDQDKLLLTDINDFNLKIAPRNPCPEFFAFLEANGIGNEGCVSEFPIKTMKAIDKWSLAVQWRLRYKRTLVDCISYCSSILNTCQDFSVNGTCGFGI